MTKIKLLLSLFLFCYQVTVAQDDIKIIQMLDQLKYTETLPAEILQTKSFVIVKTPPQSTNPNVRGNWKALAKKAQPGFKKAGIDVVAYYHIEDIFSGKEALNAFLKDFESRAFENVVFLIQEGGTNRIILTKISDNDNLLTPGQPAWQTQHIKLAEAMDHLYKTAANSSQEQENLLILGVPEFGTMPTTIKGRRGEYYDLNFSSYKLAVPAFADTAKINAVMADYPYEYNITPPELDEKQLRSDGHQYVLYYIHSTGKAVRQMLQYPTNSETAYVSEVVRNGKAEVKSYNSNTAVYKFYIKHIYSGNVFLGKKWDAAPTWHEALQNYIDNLRTELIRD